MKVDTPGQPLTLLHAASSERIGLMSAPVYGITDLIGEAVVRLCDGAPSAPLSPS
jgi:hypothetical protein